PRRGSPLPMPPAARPPLPLLDRVREINPASHLVAYGLYAPLNEAILRQHGVETVLGPEFEPELTELAGSLGSNAPARLADARPEGRADWRPVGHVRFIT